MYFNFEDYRPDTPTLPRSLTRLEVVLLTIVVYLSIIIFILVSPHLPWVKAWEAERQQALAQAQQELLQKQRDNARFVFIAPNIDKPARTPPKRPELSDIDRKAATVERAPKADQRHAVFAREHSGADGGRADRPRPPRPNRPPPRRRRAQKA